MTATDINDKFVKLVNSQVAQTQAAHRMFSPQYVATKIMPEHERKLHALIDWRNGEMARISRGYGGRLAGIEGFGATARVTVPAAVTKAINQLYSTKAAEINAAYNAQVSNLRNQYKLLNHDADLKIKAAQKARDTSTVNTQKGRKASATNDYKQALAQAKVNQQQSLKDLATHVTALFNEQSLGLNPSPNLDGSLTPPGGNNTTPGTYGPGQTINYYNQGGGPSGGVEQGGFAPPEQLVPSQTGPGTQAGSWDFSWLFDLFNFGQMTPPAIGPTPTPVDNTTSHQENPRQIPVRFIDDNQLDVFDIDAWGGAATGGYGSHPFSASPPYDEQVMSQHNTVDAHNYLLGGGSSGHRQFGGKRLALTAGRAELNSDFSAMSGNKTIQRINQLAVTPARAMGFGQWGAIVSSVISAGAQIGAAALAPKPVQPRPVVQQSVAATNYTPWLIGGGVIAVGLLVFAGTRGGKGKRK